MRSNGVITPGRALILTAALLLALSGCVKQPAADPVDDAYAILGQGAHIPVDNHLYITKPPVSEANASGMAAFGISLEDAFREAFAPFSSAVTVAKTSETRVPALASARKQKAGYVIIPTLYKADIVSFERPPAAVLSFFYSVFDVGSGAHLLMRQVTVDTGGAPLSEAKNILIRQLQTEAARLFSGPAGP